MSPVREPLSRDRVMRAAVVLADRLGIASLSMRRLGQELGVEAMSLYNHVAGKEDLFDGILELVLDEIDANGDGDGRTWKAALRERAVALRAMLLRHPWATGLLESRRPTSRAIPRNRELAFGTLRGAGFSVALATHAAVVIDSYVYGFALQGRWDRLPADDADEFDFGLNLILIGLESARRAAWTQVLA
jgi:AcrR family transcriptional regulator